MEKQFVVLTEPVKNPCPNRRTDAANGLPEWPAGTLFVLGDAPGYTYLLHVPGRTPGCSPLSYKQERVVRSSPTQPAPTSFPVLREKHQMNPAEVLAVLIAKGAVSIETVEEIAEDIVCTRTDDGEEDEKYRRAFEAMRVW